MTGTDQSFLVRLSLYAIMYIIIIIIIIIVRALPREASLLVT